MMEVFAQSFRATFLPVLEIFIVIFFAGLLMRLKWIRQEQVTALSRATVTVFLPCMMFSYVVENFKPAEFHAWWTLPASAIIISALGIILGVVLFLGKLPAKKNRLALVAFQNASYLVLPLGLALYPQEFKRFALFTFLFGLGFNLLLWSLGKFLATDRGEATTVTPTGLFDFLTPPFWANISALALVFSGLAPHLPRTLLNASHLLGDAAVPVATFVLGAVLGGLPLRLRAVWPDALRVIFAKLILLPALIFLILRLSHLGGQDPLLAHFFIIEAAVAPAVGIILQVRAYGGDEEQIGTIMLLTYAFCLLTLPAWVAAWNVWGMPG